MTGQAAGDGASEDTVSLLGLRAFGHHGVFEAERRDGQEFVVDAILSVNAGAAAAADDLSMTADYGVLAGRLAAIVSGEPVSLIETLAERLAAACLEDPAVTRARITVHKPGAPMAVPVRDVTVTISRSRG